MANQTPLEIAFFDVETTIPSRPGSGYALLEFGSIIVCARKLVEVGSYSTLIRPIDPNLISASSVRCNGITKETVANAPSFSEVADQIFTILDGRIWAGHNIARFDCVRIREAFAEIGKVAPEAKGMIDTLPLLTQKFGKRAGNMKMASLATYFGLGQQKHRSLDDVRMNLEVLKYCATVLFLETSFPDVIFKAGLMENTSTVIIQDNTDIPPVVNSNLSTPSNISSKDSRLGKAKDPHSTPLPDDDASDLITHIEQMNIDSSLRNDQSPEVRAPIADAECSNSYAEFLEANKVSVDCISVSEVPFHYYVSKTVFHRDAPLKMCSYGIRVQFGVSSKFFDHVGRPKLNILVNVPDNLCKILDACERAAQKSSIDSGSSSEWRPVVKKNGYSTSSSVRLHIPTIANGDSSTYATEIYKKEPSGNNQKLVFNNTDIATLEQLFVSGTILDAFFSIDIYDFQQNAGIRLVAKKLVVHSM